MDEPATAECALAPPLSLWASSIDVDANADIAGSARQTSSPTEPGRSCCGRPPVGGTIAFLESDRAAEPRADERYGDKGAAQWFRPRATARPRKQAHDRRDHIDPAARGFSAAATDPLYAVPRIMHATLESPGLHDA
jgi:hypothetical protein